MHFIPLRLKFMFIALVSLGGIGLLAMNGLNAVNEIRNMTQLRDIVTLTKLQMRIDMMHDAINGNVILSLSARPEELLEITKEMEGNISTVQESLDSLKRVNLPEEFRQDFATLGTEFAIYIDESRKTMAALSTDNASGQVAFKEKFSPIFQKLVDLQENLQDRVNAYSESKAEKGIASAAYEEEWLERSAVLSIALGLFIPLYAHFSLFRPQRRLLAIADCLSGPDSASCEAIPYGHRKDEIGALAKTLLALRSSVDARNALADNFEKKVKHAVDIVASAATEMEATAKQMAAAALQSEDKLADLSMGISGAASNIQQCSAAVEQISTSINEISKQVAEASSVNANALNEAHHVNELAEHLSAASGKVSAINAMITAVAAKINLLSLNATIEAARAGEAGKGFAVVASEVKTLAGQTATSASEITGHVKSIQQSSDDTLNGVKSINDVITKINAISSIIASAIEEQGAGAQDIAKNMKEATEKAVDVSNNAAMTANLAKASGESAGQMVRATGELSQQAELLRKEVESFLRSIRGGVNAA